MGRSRSNHDLVYRIAVYTEVQTLSRHVQSLQERRLEMGHKAPLGSRTAPGRRSGWVERGLIGAGMLLPARVRDRYVEEWRDALYEVLYERETAWYQLIDTLAQCVRAAVVLALLLRIRRLRTARW